MQYGNIKVLFDTHTKISMKLKPLKQETRHNKSHKHNIQENISSCFIMRIINMNKCKTNDRIIMIKVQIVMLTILILE